jgi:hypothetical protein
MYAKRENFSSMFKMWFGSMKNLRKHRLKECKGDNSVRNFECDECDKLFDDKWKINANKKNHKKHKCDVCSKTFQDIMKNHKKMFMQMLNCIVITLIMIKTAHADESIFINEDSELCRFGKICDRINCMFKHNIVSEEVSDEEVKKMSVKMTSMRRMKKNEKMEDERNDNEVEVEFVCETLDFTVYLLCRDYSSRKIEENLTTDLNNCADVERENVVVHSKLFNFV